uniref:Uncharacterized protein n=1 Tax=Steinernema glaseri TaxID=37863 RepID=A0A1I7YIL3_9BILA
MFRNLIICMKNRFLATSLDRCNVQLGYVKYLQTILLLHRAATVTRISADTSSNGLASLGLQIFDHPSSQNPKLLYSNGVLKIEVNQHMHKYGER